MAAIISATLENQEHVRMRQVAALPTRTWEDAASDWLTVLREAAEIGGRP
jgi:hypothetical protein